MTVLQAIGLAMSMFLMSFGFLDPGAANPMYGF